MVDGLKTTAKEDRARGVAYKSEWYDAAYFSDHVHRRSWYYPTAFILQRELRPRSMLDVGCGVGLLVEAFTLEGVDAHGVDVAPDALAMARPEVRDRLQRCDVTKEKLPFPDASFDLATCIEVIEHLPTQENLFREVYRVLKPGGRFFLQTPKPGTEEADDPTHIAVKPRKEWVAMARQVGFGLDDDNLMRWEHDLPMPLLGRKLGWLRFTRAMKRYVVRTGTRTLFVKPGAR